MRIEALASQVNGAKERWGQLMARWSELGLPGSPYFPTEFLAYGILSTMNATPEALAGQVKAAKEAIDRVKQEIGYISDNDLLALLLVAYLLQKSAQPSESSAGTTSASVPIEPQAAAAPEPPEQVALQEPVETDLGEGPVEAQGQTEVKGCCHVGTDRCCINCTEDRTVDCSSCAETIVESKGHKCTRCDNIYCDDCVENSLNDKGYCDDCQTLDCDGCDGQIDSGDEATCSNSDCENPPDYCQACAVRLLDDNGQCPACSGEDEYTCDDEDCGRSVIKSRVTECKNFATCNRCYCKGECAEKNLVDGLCPDCREPKELDLPAVTQQPPPRSAVQPPPPPARNHRRWWHLFR